MTYHVYYWKSYESEGVCEDDVELSEAANRLGTKATMLLLMYGLNPVLLGKPGNFQSYEVGGVGVGMWITEWGVVKLYWSECDVLAKDMAYNDYCKEKNYA